MQDEFDPKVNRGVLPKDYQRCVVCGLTRKVSDLTEAWQAGDGSDPVLVGLSCVDGCEPAHREAEAAKKDEILSRAEKAEARVVELEAMLRDPEAVRANLLRGTIANPPGLAWLGDGDGPVAELRQRAEKAERERDEARAKQAAMAEQLTAETEALREARSALDMVRTDRNGVWLWQGDGHDDITSLVCPVVMSAGTLRELLKERDAARAEAAMLREALADMEDACAQVASWSVESIEYSDAVRVAARTALAATPGDWLAARDRALAERVREAVLGKPMDLPKDNAAWCTSCLENIQTAVEVRANAIDLDALVGGES